MSLRLPLLKNILFISLFSALIFSCTKITTTDIGGGLIPPVDGVNTTDILLDVVSKNLSYDTVAVNLSDDHSLGYISNDPLFGITDASINVQIKPTVFPLNFEVGKDSTFLDSAVLVLSVKGIWGDSFPPLSLHVFSMDREEVFSQNSLYPNTTTFERDEELTANSQARIIEPFRLNDSAELRREAKYANQLRIPLSASFGETLLHTLDNTTNKAYLSDSLFDLNFRGFIISADAGGKSLLRINLVDTNTKVALYYHYTDKDTANKIDTSIKYFRVNSNSSASSNTILHNRQGAQIASFLPGNGSPESDDLIFMQTGPGTIAKIHLPGISDLPNLIIHRAELLMEQVPDASDQYLTAPNLFLQAVNDSGKRFAIPNDIVFGSGYITNLSTFGVAPKIKQYAGSNINFYSFDITRFVQGVIAKKEPAYDLLLSAPYYNNIYIAAAYNSPLSFISTSPLNSPAIGRIRLGGGSNEQHRMQLHIVYSKL